MTDVLADVSDALIAEGVDVAIVRRVLVQVRTRWAGERVYIRQSGPEREAEIRMRIQAGEHLDHIARKAGVSPSTVRRRRSSWLD
jgi:DNA-binding NarL/FixJ family response regulator